MMLVEETAPPAEALPVAGLRAHLRLGSGFAGGVDAAEDAALASFLRAAIAAIEARTGKVLLRRRFRMRIEDWREPECQPLPLAPVASVDEVVVTDRRGVERAVEAEAWRLVPDNQRPLLRGAGLSLPVVPAGGFVTITFTAGFGSGWEAIPPDLAHAVILLAAQYHDDRGAAGLGAALPFPVAALIERWRAVRVLTGRVAR
ncbi:hypothetical protein GI374_09555 [Paracoccus sp. S-4012]|uniref:head-tail connector protein n=1 Tax=Paracoccus sp. S-4012 TaxID=2665648 RepID=UPI0012AF47C1|nr:hypothetical protein [Paracoccus sp. S-4012]MRX50684.1 hypothetical protein [Paracoccus sp. S-4012]